MWSLLLTTVLVYVGQRAQVDDDCLFVSVACWILQTTCNIYRLNTCRFLLGLLCQMCVSRENVLRIKWPAKAIGLSVELGCTISLSGLPSNLIEV